MRARLCVCGERLLKKEFIHRATSLAGSLPKATLLVLGDQLEELQLMEKGQPIRHRTNHSKSCPLTVNLPNDTFTDAFRLKFGHMSAPAKVSED